MTLVAAVLHYATTHLHRMATTYSTTEETRDSSDAFRVSLQRIAREERSHADFCRVLLEELTSYFNAGGAVVRLRNELGNWSIAASQRFPELQLGSEHAPQRHGVLVFETFVSGRPKIIPPQKSLNGDLEANPSDGLLLIAPLVSGGRMRGVVELLLPPGLNADRQLELLAGVQAAGEALALFEQQQQVRQHLSRDFIADAVEGYCRAVYRDLSVRRTAYAIANEGKRLLSCERLTVLMRRGGSFQVEAVSGLDAVEQRSAAAKDLAAMAWIASTGLEPIHYPSADEPLPPQVQAAVGEYVDESFARTVSVLPLVRLPVETTQLARQPLPLGALVVEWFGEAKAPAGYKERCRFAVEHAAAALDNARQFEIIPGICLWKRVASLREDTSHAKRKRMLAMVGIPLLLTLALAFIPADFTIHAPAALQPARNQFAFAPGDGVVHRVHVRHGDHVETGQPLVELCNVDLDVQLSELKGRRRAAQEQLSGVERSLYEDSVQLPVAERHRLSGDRSRLQQELAAHDEQVRLLERKKEQLVIRSPLAGEILTWNVEKQLLHRPVRAGQSLLEIGDVGGPWELELKVPEDDIGHIAEAAGSSSAPLTVRYRLAAAPQQDYYANVQEVHLAAEVRGEAGNTVIVRAGLNQAEPPPKRAGAEASAKVHCGRRSLGYVWLHDALDFLRTKVWFRIS